jgi:hypothetical protein
MAEVQGIQQPRSRSSIGVQRVCATPFLVMALPCWMASHLRTDAVSIEQVAWVLRFGRLIGWVDDFEDLAFDAVARQFNRLLEPRAALNLKELAERVADSVEALEALRMRRARSEDLWSRQLLRLLLTSWLGGPMRSEGARWDKEWG